MCKIENKRGPCHFLSIKSICRVPVFLLFLTSRLIIPVPQLHTRVRAHVHSRHSKRSETNKVKHTRPSAFHWRHWKSLFPPRRFFYESVKKDLAPAVPQLSQLTPENSPQHPMSLRGAFNVLWEGEKVTSRTKTKSLVPQNKVKCLLCYICPFMISILLQDHLLSVNCIKREVSNVIWVTLRRIHFIPKT